MSVHADHLHADPPTVEFTWDVEGRDRITAVEYGRRRTIIPTKLTIYQLSFEPGELHVVVDGRIVRQSDGVVSWERKSISWGDVPRAAAAHDGDTDKSIAAAPEWVRSYVTRVRSWLAVTP